MPPSGQRRVRSKRKETSDKHNGYAFFSVHGWWSDWEGIFVLALCKTDGQRQRNTIEYRSSETTVERENIIRVKFKKRLFASEFKFEHNAIGKNPSIEFWSFSSAVVLDALKKYNHEITS